METTHQWIELAAGGIEALAVVLMTVFIALGAARLLLAGSRSARLFVDVRLLIGKALLLGLELLVVADVIRTVTLEPTLENLAGLAALVLVRTFLGWTLSLEIEGHWPWQGAGAAAPEKRIPAAEPAAEGDR